jgi:hypothetical protein
MGEAARRKRQGFDGRAMGEAALSALNEDAGGVVWALARGGSTPTHFIVLDAESADVRTGHITNGEAASTPHRVVGLVLIRRGEPWLEAMVFDPCEEYRSALYDELAANALHIADEAVGADRVDEVWHEIVSSTRREKKIRTILKPDEPASEQTA